MNSFVLVVTNPASSHLVPDEDRGSVRAGGGPLPSQHLPFLWLTGEKHKWQLEPLQRIPEEPRDTEDGGQGWWDATSLGDEAVTCGPG